ncbi:hypothetical protein F5Y03DRAFT_406825 [Xylaria venustula]|nr:hypothetical protein F5Y03DRAFT_406825 [Xylaria venustula]
MATYEQLQRDPVSRVLFNNRITTMEGLLTLGGHAFIALDTEHGPIKNENSRALYQVGLAYLSHIPGQLRLGDSIAAHIPNWPPRLDNFIKNHHIESLTLNINLSKQTRKDIIRYRGGIPNRRPSRLGYERQVDLGDLESAMIEFIQSHNHNGTKPVLVGFGMAAEWNYLLRTFPQVMSYFMVWMDLRDIAEDITTAIGVIPSRVSVLQALGYHWKDIQGSNKYGTADNAANDAISVLAMTIGFLNPQNQEKLRFRQKCSRIARHTYNENDFTFGATIQSQENQSQEKVLPKTINSSMKLARYFFDFMPSSTGLKSAEVAFITFENESDLDRFMQANNQRLLPAGETLLVRPIIKGSVVANGTFKREQRQRLKAIRKAEMLEHDYHDIDLSESYTTMFQE